MAKFRHKHSEKPDRSEALRHRDDFVPGPSVKGTISVNAQSCGFVSQNNGEPDLFIPPQYLNGAISGDTVEVVVDLSGDPERPSGQIKRIIQRQVSTIVGCVFRLNDGRWAVRPLRRELPGVLLFAPGVRKKLQEGDWIQVKLEDTPKLKKPAGVKSKKPGRADDSFKEQYPFVKVLKTLGTGGNVTSDLDAIVEEYNIPRRYTKTEEMRAARLKPGNVPRVDWTKHLVVTIDPADARDYDDALSYQEGPGKNCCTVGVHIADVSAYVKPGGSLDKAASLRGFTSYLPGRTIPMLPAVLANDLCSLKADTDRLAHSVFVTFNKNSGSIVSYKRVHTLIRSRARLCYDEVQRFFDGEQVKLPPRVAPMLKKLLAISQKSRDYRATVEQFLPMEMPEIRVVCSENPPSIAGVQTVEHSPSHELVEEFMLAANQCVADELTKKEIPGLFRNHLQPESEDMTEFSGIASLILGKKVKSLQSRQAIVKFLRSIQDNPARDVLEMMFLRRMQRASYSSENLGHFGLGKVLYSHFTSPIRRYTDLVVHQQLTLVDQKRKTRSQEEMEMIALDCTKFEENCDQAAFAASDRMKIRYIDNSAQGKSGKTALRGIVVKASKKGIQVYLPDFGLYAIVPDRALPFKQWKFNASKQSWLHLPSGKNFELRSTANFLLLNADPVRGELFLKFASL